MALSKEQFQQLRDKGLSVEQIVKFERGEKPTKPASVVPPKEPSFLNKVGQNTLGMVEDLTFGIPRTIVEQTVGRGVGALTGDKELEQKLMNLPRGNQFISGIGKAVADPIVEGYQAVMPNFPLTPEIPAKKMAQSGGLGLLGLLAQKAVPEKVQPTQHGVAEMAIRTATDPRTFLFGGGIEGTGKAIKDTISEGKTLFKAPSLNKNIGKKLVDSYRTRIAVMEPEALAQAGLKPEVIKDVLKTKETYGLTSLPTETQADELFSSTLSKAKEVKSDQVVSALRDVVANNPKETVLKNLLSRLTKSTNVDNMIKGLGNTVDASEISNVFKQVNNLFGKYGGQIDGELQMIKNAIYDALEASGVEGAKKARDIFRISRTTTKAQNLLSKPESTLRAFLEGKAKSAVDPTKVGARQVLREQVGPVAEEVITYGDKVAARGQKIDKLKRYGKIAGAVGVGGAGLAGLKKFLD